MAKKNRQKRSLIYKRAKDFFGQERQLWQFFEELGEVLTAMNKFIKRDQISKRDMASEIADLKIMIEQFEDMFELHELVDDEMEYKIERLKQRLEREGIVNTGEFV